MTTPIKAALDAVRYTLRRHIEVQDRRNAQEALDQIEQHMEKMRACIVDLSSGGNHHDKLNALEKHADIIKDARHE